MSAAQVSRALPLIQLIYQAAKEPDVWQQVAEAVADDLGGAAVAINLEVPGRQSERLSYRMNSDPRYAQIFVDYVRAGRFPWPLEEISTERFIDGDDFFPREDLQDTGFYKEYMKPQGMACEGALGVVFGTFEGRPMATAGIYRLEQGRRFDASDREFLDLLVPHISQAYAIHRELQGYRNQWTATSEVLDRVPIGVMLIDAECRVSALNKMAENILSQNDGLRLDDRRPRASEAGNADAELQKQLGFALASSGEPPTSETGIVVERPSGRHPFALCVATLSPAPRLGFAHDARAVIFLSDAERHDVGKSSLLASLYNLTLAEADIATLLSAGHSLEEAAAIRGVTIHTARSQVKNVFSKTGVHRQSDLVRLILASVTALRPDSSKSD